MGLWDSILEECQQQDSLCCVHADQYQPQEFLTGSVFAWTEELLGLRTIDDAARFDGFKVLDLDRVLRVTTGGPYLAKLANRVDRDLIPPDPPLSSFEMDAILALVESSGQACKLVDRFEEDISGFIVGLTEDLVTLRSYNALHFFGNVNIPFENISQIHFGGPQQVVLNSLGIAGGRSPHGPHDFSE